MSTLLYFYFLSLSLHCTVPMWAIGAIVVVVLALVGCLAFCIYKKCLGGKKKTKKVRERKGGRRRMKKEGDGEGGEVRVWRSKHVKGKIFRDNTFYWPHLVLEGMDHCQ